MTQPRIITVDGVDYAEDQLTDQQKVMLNHITDLDSKASAAKFALDQLLVGKEAFINMLANSLKADIK